MKWNLKKILKELVVTLFLIVIFANAISYFKKPYIENDQLPKINATLIDGRVFSTKDTMGKPLLIHFWATWCPTCKLEAGNIETVSNYFNILSIVVNSGSNKELQAYMRGRELNFNVLNDADHGFSDAFAVKAFPTTFIFDSKGKLIFSEVGYTSTLGLFIRMWWAD